MAKLSLSSLGTLLKKKRGGRGIREASGEIGISSATLSRIENGKVPDLDTFSKVCKWLKIDPGDVLGYKDTAGGKEVAGKNVLFAHLKADKNLDTKTIQSLAEMILRARAMISSE